MPLTGASHGPAPAPADRSGNNPLAGVGCDKCRPERRTVLLQILRGLMATHTYALCGWCRHQCNQQTDRRACVRMACEGPLLLPASSSHTHAYIHHKSANVRAHARQGLSGKLCHRGAGVKGQNCAQVVHEARPINSPTCPKILGSAAHQRLSSRTEARLSTQKQVLLDGAERKRRQQGRAPREPETCTEGPKSTGLQEVCTRKTQPAQREQQQRCCNPSAEQPRHTLRRWRCWG